MRKHMREILRRQAEKKGVKPSRYVRQIWDKYQIKKVGIHRRASNAIYGTKPKRK